MNGELSPQLVIGIAIGGIVGVVIFAAYSYFRNLRNNGETSAEIFSKIPFLNKQFAKVSSEANTLPASATAKPASNQVIPAGQIGETTTQVQTPEGTPSIERSKSHFSDTEIVRPDAAPKITGTINTDFPYNALVPLAHQQRYDEVKREDAKLAAQTAATEAGASVATPAKPQPIPMQSVPNPVAAQVIAPAQTSPVAADLSPAVMQALSQLIQQAGRSQQQSPAQPVAQAPVSMLQPQQIQQPVSGMPQVPLQNPQPVQPQQPAPMPQSPFAQFQGQMQQNIPIPQQAPQQNNQMPSVMQPLLQAASMPQATMQQQPMPQVAQQQMQPVQPTQPQVPQPAPQQFMPQVQSGASYLPQTPVMQQVPQTQAPAPVPVPVQQPQPFVTPQNQPSVYQQTPMPVQQPQPITTPYVMPTPQNVVESQAQQSMPAVSAAPQVNIQQPVPQVKTPEAYSAPLVVEAKQTPVTVQPKVEPPKAAEVVVQPQKPVEAEVPEEKKPTSPANFTVPSMSEFNVGAPAMKKEEQRFQQQQPKNLPDPSLLVTKEKTPASPASNIVFPGVTGPLTAADIPSQSAPAAPENPVQQETPSAPAPQAEQPQVPAQAAAPVQPQSPSHFNPLDSVLP